MNKLLWILPALAFLGTTVVETAWAQVVDGVQVGPQAPEGRPPFQVPEGSLPGSIDFDDATAPCFFADAVALTNEYGALGVTFTGPGGNDGGAVLDECGGFSVSGYSPPNFLVFNLGLSLSDGGTPQGPETLTFAQPLNSVQINGGHSSAGTITLECFDGGGTSLGSDSITATIAVQTLSVAAVDIARCVLSFTGIVAVFDDLVYDPPIPVELQSFTIE
ncbi:MAG: hypothetical protein GY856_02910 [bacterium]|nr:hypothetical protein [bacterium]